jgi:hypothetical protein
MSNYQIPEPNPPRIGLTKYYLARDEVASNSLNNFTYLIKGQMVKSFLKNEYVRYKTKFYSASRDNSCEKSQL